MKALIEEINEKLESIITDLKVRKQTLEDSLATIQRKIDEKIDEAKKYKDDVDKNKNNIKTIETEIESLEQDLADLTNKFSNKDLNAILDTANKEINMKISSRVHEINKNKDKINELTEKARMIKDLLLSLKKDKDAKKSKLDELDVALKYYETEINKIINFSEENPDNLVVDDEEIREEDDSTNYTFEPIYETKVVDDSPVFDEIKSIAEEENDEEIENDFGTTFVSVEADETEEVDTKDLEKEDDNNVFMDENINSKEDDKDTKDATTLEEENFDSKGLGMPTFENTSNNNSEDFNDKDNPFTKDSFLEEDNGIFDFINNRDLPLNETTNVNEEITDDIADDNVSDIVSLFEHDKTQKIDFKTLNDSIDKEYENIFGEKIDEKKFGKEMDYVPTDDDFLDFKVTNEKNIFDTEEDVKEPISEVKTNLNEQNFIDFCVDNELDEKLFSTEDKDYLISIYNESLFKKIIDVIKNNKIDLNNIYEAAHIFDMSSLELEKMINKLLLANQTTTNIGLVLDTLPEINSYDLNEVIESYGQNVKDTDITELIVKAKHLKDIGGGK
jgi:hypothetical protein